MKTAVNLIGILSACGSAAAFIWVGGNHRDAAVHKVKRTPVLVELFTSEGCSSCPPADALLKQIQKKQPVENALIVPLGEHVDYWDGASWRDRFSTNENSQRQVFYAHHLHIEGPYTPQIVVDGSAEVLGSDESATLNAISNSAVHRRAQVTLDASKVEAGTSRVTINVEGLDKARADADNAVFLAIIEDNLESHVKGGENGGRTLAHTAVMRRLIRLADTPANTSWNKTVSLKLDPKWKLGDTQLVAFVQGTKTGHIFGCNLANFATE